MPPTAPSDLRAKAGMSSFSHCSDATQSLSIKARISWLAALRLYCCLCLLPVLKHALLHEVRCPLPRTPELCALASRPFHRLSHRQQLRFPGRDNQLAARHADNASAVPRGYRWGLRWIRPANLLMVEMGPLLRDLSNVAGRRAFRRA